MKLQKGWKKSKTAFNVILKEMDDFMKLNGKETIKGNHWNLESII